MAPVTPCALGHTRSLPPPLPPRPRTRSLQRSLIPSCLRLSLPRSVPCKYFQLHAPLPRSARTGIGRSFFFFFTLTALPRCTHTFVGARSGHARGARRTAVRISRRCTTEVPTRRYTLGRKVYKFEDYTGSHLLPPPPLIDTIVETYTCARGKARGTEQNRGGSSWLPQAEAASAAGNARRTEHFNWSRESLRGPPILIRIPIFKPLEVA